MRRLIIISILKWLDENLEKLILSLLITAIILIMLLQIVMRYLFNNSLSWTEEFCRYCYIYVMFIGMSFAIKESSNLRVDVIVEMLPIGLRKIIMALVDLLVFMLLCLMFFSSIATVGSAYKIGNYSAGLKMPLYIIYCSVPIGFGLSIFRHVELCVKKVCRLRKSNNMGEEIL